MNWNTVLDLLIEFGYNAATSLMSYVVGTNVLAMPKPAAYLVAALVGFVGMANHWRALRKSAVVLLALSLGVSGCATMQRVETDLSKATSEDLDQAIAMASAANPVVDPGAAYRARCYVTLKKYVPTGSTVGSALLPKGVVSTVELAMELDAKLRSGAGIPPDIHADCAVISVNLAEFAGRVGLKLAPIPGASAVGGLLK